MPKLEYLLVELDNNGVIPAGQNLIGRVKLKLSEAMKCRGVRVAMVGEAHVHWSESRSSGTGKHRRRRTVHYSAHETYFNTTVTLFGKEPGQSGDDPRHPPGSYEYPFWMQLSPTLPSCYEGGTGYVRYYVKAVIDRPWKFDHSTKVAFSVLSVLDLNTQPNSRHPLHGERSDMIGCLWCKSGPLQISFNVQKTGFVPGEYFLLRGEVENHTNNELSWTKVKLIANVQYHATRKTKTVPQTVLEMIKQGPVQPGDKVEWNDWLRIPPLVPSSLVGCQIIDIDYVLALEANPSGPHFCRSVPLAVIIGTVPLVGSFSTPETYAAAPGGQIDAGEAPPPSYAECFSFPKANIRGEEDNEHTNGPADFAPAYTFYGTPLEPTAPLGNF